MHFFFSVVVPANTPEDQPVVERLRLTKAVITKMLIVIPPGSQGLLHLQILYHEHQLYPLNPGGSYSGDETNVEFDEYQPIIVNPYEVKARLWNLDTENDHQCLIGITMLRPEEMGREIPETSIAALSVLIGQEI